MQSAPIKSSNGASSKIGDFGTHRPIAQSNAATTALKITQVGPVSGSNVIVSRMDNSIGARPPNSSSSPIPIAGPLAASAANNYYFNLNANIPRSINSRSTSNPGIVQPPPQQHSSVTPNFYSNSSNNVTKFTNLTVASAGSKNPLKSTHYTVQNSSTSNTTASTSTTSSGANPSTHPNSNLTAPNTTGIAPKTTLKASDLIHILPNLFNTLKRRNSNGGSSGGTNRGSGTGNGNTNTNNMMSSHHQPYYNPNTSATNTLAAAVAAATNSGKPMTSSSAAAFVAEQLLNVAASVPMSDDSSSSPPPMMFSGNSFSSKKPRLTSSNSSGLQCGVCGKSYKHRNCLSKHMWEHHDSWEHTKKVCQTKHQQVQLLEAAQVLSEIISGVPHASQEFSESDNNNDNDNNSIRSSSDDEEDDGEIVNEMREMDLVPQQPINTAISDDENVSIGD